MIRVVRAKQTHVPEIVKIWGELMDGHMVRDPIFTRSKVGHMKKYMCMIHLDV